MNVGWCKVADDDGYYVTTLRDSVAGENVVIVVMNHGKRLGVKDERQKALCDFIFYPQYFTNLRPYPIPKP